MVRDWRPDLVVHEVLELAGPILAARLGVRGVVHGFGPMFPLYGLLAEPAGAAAGDPALWEHLSTESYLDICPPALRPDGPPPWTQTIALRPTAGEPGPLPPAVAELLADDQPLAYFTLGTVKNEATTDFAAGLAALSDFDGNVLATTGRPIDRDSLGALPGRLVLAEFAPQAAVLPHVDLLLSHAGAGTMLGGLCEGLPQVALPRGTDQPENAALLARAGAGVVVPMPEFGEPAIRAAVATLTGDSSYAEHARRVRAEIEAMPGADEVWAELARHHVSAW